MKLSAEERESLRRRVLDARSSCMLSNAQIAAATGVDPGQVSKICRGRFETVSDSVMKICNMIGARVEPRAVNPDEARASASSEQTRRTAAWRRLERSVKRAWDETPEGAARLARLLDAVVDVTRR